MGVSGRCGVCGEFLPASTELAGACPSCWEPLAAPAPVRGTFSGASVLVAVLLASIIVAGVQYQMNALYDPPLPKEPPARERFEPRVPGTGPDLPRW